MKLKSEYKRNTTARLLAGTGLSVACLLAPARSQEETSLAVHELDRVVVAANRSELPIQRVGSSVELLDRFELENGEELLLLDALRYVPGLHLRNNGNPGAVFGVTTRGMSSNRPTVLVNGIEVSNPADGEIFNLGNLFTDGVSRVEVVKGAQSSLYGADALAGVIAIDTFSESQPEGGRASLAYGSFDTIDYGFGHSGSRGGFRWSVDARRHESDGYSAEDPARGAAWADDDAYENTTLSANAQYAVDERTRWFLSALYLDSYAEYDPGDPAWVWGEPAVDNYFATEKLFLRAGSDFRLAEHWESEASVSYSDVDTASHSDENRYPSDGDRYQLEWVNRISASESWDVVAGVEHEIEDNRSDAGDRDNSSVFVDNAFRLSERLDWTLGGRYDDNSAYGAEETFRTTFSYRFPEQDARLRGSFGTSFQAPSFYQLFNSLYGNSELAPESGEGWDLGVEKAFADGRILVSVTAFGNEVDDKIVWDGVYRNVDRYESSGFESSLRYTVSDSLRLLAGHTYSEAKENGTVEALRVPRNVGSLGAHWSGAEGKYGLNLDALFVSSQVSDGTQRFSGERLDGYTVVNLAGSYQVNDLSRLWVRVGNLFDEDYEEVRGYQTAGINVTGGVRLSF